MAYGNASANIIVSPSANHAEVTAYLAILDFAPIPDNVDVAAAVTVLVPLADVDAGNPVTVSRSADVPYGDLYIRVVAAKNQLYSLPSNELAVPFDFRPAPPTVVLG